MTLSLFRKLALLEGATLVLLMLVAVPLKRMMGIPEMVSIVGPIHGVAFIIYIVTMTSFFQKENIPMSKWLLGFIAAFIPFGSFVFERVVLKPLA